MEPKFTNHASICSFCGRAQNEVKKMVAGYKGIIRDECISVCMVVFLRQGSELFEEVIAKARAAASEPENSN
jgi:ATP-dependent protease Clp ATPase subunit